MGLKIDIGCGQSIRPGFQGLDIMQGKQKYTRDILRGLPFADNTVSEINLNHVLEHVHGGDDLLFFISELYRVLRHEGKLHIRVPHSSEKVAHDPTHVSFWNEDSLIYFSGRDHAPKLAIPSQYKWEFHFAKIERNGPEMHVEAQAWKPSIIDEVANEIGRA